MSLTKPSELTPQMAACLTKHKTFGDFCRSYSPANLLPYTHNARKCFETEISPTMVTLNKVYGQGSAAKWIGHMLAYLNTMFEAEERANASLLPFVAESIASTYYYLKASELMLFFRNVIGGKYGKVLYKSTFMTDFSAAIKDKFMPERAMMYDRLERERREREEEKRRQEWLEADPERMNKIVKRLTDKYDVRDVE